MRAQLQWTVLTCLVLAAPSAGSETPDAEDAVSEPQTGGGDEEQDGEQGRAEDEEKPAWKQPLLLGKKYSIGQ